MQSPPLVSVVIPVFRGVPYVRKAIESALAQSWPAVEVIVVDDGSDDGGATREVAMSFGDRIRYLHKENGGVATALNAGIEAMRGKYLSWLSHDDVMHPRKIEWQMEALAAHPGTAIAFGDYDLINSNGTFLQSVDVTTGFEGRNSIWAIFEGRINGCAVLVPRECFDRCGLFDPSLPTTQDYALWFEMARIYPFVPVHKSVVEYRIHPDQGSGTKRHLAEASLLWIAMLEALSVEERVAAAGSDAEFWIRCLRRQRLSYYSGALPPIEDQARNALKDQTLSLVWSPNVHADIEVEATLIAAAVAAIEVCGPQVTEVTVLSPGADGHHTLNLERMQLGRPYRVVRGLSDSVADDLALLAGAARAPMVAIASSARPLASASVRLGLEKLILDEADGWLASASTGPEGWLAGGLFRVDAVRRALDGSTGSASPLLAVATDLRLEVSSSHKPTHLVPSENAAKLANSPVFGEPVVLVLTQGEEAALQEADAISAGLSETAAVIHGVLRPDGVTLSSVGPRDEEMRRVPDAAAAMLEQLGLCRTNVIVAQPPTAALRDLAGQLGVPMDLTVVAPASHRTLAPDNPVWKSLVAAAEDCYAVGDGARELPALAGRAQTEPDAPARGARIGRSAAAGAAPRTRLQRGLERLTIPRQKETTILLFVDQSEPGSLRYATEVAAAAARHMDVLFGWSARAGQLAFSSESPTRAEVVVSVPGDLDLASNILKERGITRVDLILPATPSREISSIVERLGVPFDVTLVGVIDADAGTRYSRTWLEGADRRIVPGRHAAANASDVFPGLVVTEVLPPERFTPETFLVRPVARGTDEPMRVLVFARPDRMAMILDVAARVKASAAAISFHVIGETGPVTLEDQRNIQLYGDWTTDELSTVIGALRPHLAWLPSAAAPGWGFDLSDALLHGLPVLTVARGAAGERLHGRHATWVLPETQATAAGYAAHLESLASGWDEVPEIYPDVGGLPTVSADYYRNGYFRPR